MAKVSTKAVGEWEPETRLVGEFEVTRPTPSQSENDQLGTTAGAIPLLKRWDLSPVDQSSFDPTEPPGRPATPLGGIMAKRRPKDATDKILREPRMAGEFDVTRPTPLQSENDQLGAASGDIVMLKQWDLSPVDQQSFNPAEPPGRPAGPPANTALPVITILTTLEVGQQLVCSNGTWTGAPTFTRQWWRGSAATPIAGATGNSHVLVGADNGLMIGCTVTGTNATGAVTADAAAVGPIVPARPTNAGGANLPALTGGTVVGDLLTVTNGTWTGAPSGYTYSWLRNGANRPGGITTSTLTTTAADVGATIAANVVATNAGGASTPATSNTVGPITATADEPVEDVSPPPQRNGRHRR